MTSRKGTLTADFPVEITQDTMLFGNPYSLQNKSMITGNNQKAIKIVKF